MEEYAKLPLIMAPLAGITDSVFRCIVKEYGADVTYSEMVSSRGIYYNDAKSKELMMYEVKELPFVIQLFGNDPEIMAYAAKEAALFSPSGIDINMGCPMPKVVNNGDGCALMKDISLAAKVCESVVKAVDIPVSVKFRSGWDENTINAPEFAKAMENSGAKSLTIHGRTRSQHFSGKADLDICRAVKSAVSIPVTVSGDIVDVQSAKRTADYTGCDGLMIGRGALGNPWIFTEIKSAFNGEDFTFPDACDKINMALRHARMLCDYKGETVGIKESRKFSAWYVKGLKGSAKLRNDVTRASSYGELKEIFDRYTETLKDGV